MFGIEAVPQLLAVLTHDNDGSLDGSNCREDEVEKDVGIRVDPCGNGPYIHRLDLA
ncbi:MAG: hypothetical protein LUQ32_00965 [Methanomicrobiales archaeon]|nr:hypothetical protein [Methanomicrobiales archaeon]